MKFLVLLAILGCAAANTTYLLEWPTSTERHGLTGVELLHTLGLDDYIIGEDGGMQVFASEVDMERLKVCFFRVCVCVRTQMWFFTPSPDRMLVSTVHMVSVVYSL